MVISKEPAQRYICDTTIKNLNSSEAKKPGRPVHEFQAIILRNRFPGISPDAWLAPDRVA